MATQTLSTLNYVLKEKIQPQVQYQFGMAHFLYDKVKKTADNITSTGRLLRYYISVQTTRPQGIGTRAEGGTLPTARNVAFGQMYFDLAYLYGAINYSGQSLRASKGAQALIDATELQVTGITEVLKDDLARGCASNGDGVLGRILSGGSGTSLVMYDTAGYQGARLFEVGMYLDSYTSCTSTGKQAGGTNAGNSFYVTAIDLSTDTLTVVNGTGTTVNDDYIFREDTYGYPIMGIGGIVDDGTVQATFQSLARSSYPWLSAVVLSNSSTARDPTPDLLNQAVDEATARKGKPNTIYSPLNVRRTYLSRFANDTRWQGQVKKYDGGWTGLSHTAGNIELEWIADQWCPLGSMFVFNTDDLIWAEAMKPTWLNTITGGDPLYFDKTTDSYSGVIGTYLNLGARTGPRGTVLIKDLNIS
jgi:hypothetical protein